VTRQRAECRQVGPVSEDVPGGCLLRVGKELKLVLLRLRHEVTARRAWRGARWTRRAGAWACTWHAQSVSPLWPHHAVDGRRGTWVHHWHHRRHHVSTTRRRAARQQTISLALLTLLTIVVLLSRARLVGQVLSHHTTIVLYNTRTIVLHLLFVFLLIFSLFHYLRCAKISINFRKISTRAPSQKSILWVSYITAKTSSELKLIEL